MAVRPVVRMGTPSLFEASVPVTDFGSEALAALVEDLWQTMADEGGIGIAAPQIGVNLRLVVFGLEPEPDAGDATPARLAVPRTVLANPRIEPLSMQTELGYEGCLSVPGMRGLVPRYRHIRYSGQDLHGRHFEREASDYHARVVQHECDHLDGILYPMRIEDLRDFGFAEEMDAARLNPAAPRCI
ncbi:MAG: peptide deformylase [Gammaproteobacteria bacterium]|nr:peptide deformylase [Gammaproteobacteria bacterium]